ncbi:MAG: hypothetical protein OEV20_09555 [Actinomycetota bacterium]|nr:hypothetical protein [Actinomycetota bacterium]
MSDQSVPDDTVEAAAAALAARHPDVGGALDDRARARLAAVLADPAGESWMDAAGLLDGDSCGYPVTGGLYDVKSDLGALPAAAADPGLREQVIARLMQEWSDDFVLTGRARLDRPWQSYVAEEAAR